MAREAVSKGTVKQGKLVDSQGSCEQGNHQESCLIVESRKSHFTALSPIIAASGDSFKLGFFCPVADS